MSFLLPEQAVRRLVEWAWLNVPFCFAEPGSETTSADRRSVLLAIVESTTNLFDGVGVGVGVGVGDGVGVGVGVGIGVGVGAVGVTLFDEADAPELPPSLVAVAVKV